MAKKQMRKRGGRRRKIPRGIKSETASLLYTSTSAPIMPNQAYSLRNFSLTNATRAIQVASAYQYYRITKVTCRFRPVSDTFSAGLTNSGSVPHFYYRIDKEGTFPVTTTLQTLKTAGAKPIRFDDKVVSVSFKPAVVQASVAAPSGGALLGNYSLGTSKVSPWLTTNGNAYNESAGIGWIANSVDHLGMLYAIDQDVLNPSGAPIGYMSFEVMYEFKKPLWTSGEGATLATVNADTLEILIPEGLPESKAVVG